MSRISVSQPVLQLGPHQRCQPTGIPAKKTTTILLRKLRFGDGRFEVGGTGGRREWARDVTVSCVLCVKHLYKQ